MRWRIVFWLLGLVRYVAPDSREGKLLDADLSMWAETCVRLGRVRARRAVRREAKRAEKKRAEFARFRHGGKRV